MQNFRPGDIARVPFPQVERDRRQYRPALVVSVFDLPNPLLWVLMITSADNAAWDGDIPIEDYAAVGLPAPSVIRTAKIGTVEVRQSEVAGRIPDTLMGMALERVGSNLAYPRAT